MLAGLLSLLAIVLLAQAAGGAKEPEPPTRRALLIGINEYQALPDLRGAVNDLVALRAVLIQRFGFPEEHIEMLVDAEATRDRIVEAMHRLVARAGPEDVVYLHFSGHGSQVTDFDGDEEDGLDETIVPHDGRTPGVPDITDDEIAEILDGLGTPHAVIALDSCHSGTGTRDASGIRVRAVPRDMRDELYRDRPRTRAAVPVHEIRHVLLTGAADHEKALDGPVDGTPYGLFSFSFAQSLTRAAEDATPLDVFRGVQQEFERIQGQLGLPRMPRPQLEGPPGRFEARLFPPLSEEAAEIEIAEALFLSVSPASEGVVRLEGTHPQAAVGSLWALHPPGATRFPPEQAFGWAQVIEVSGGALLAQVLDAVGPVPDGARAILLAAAPPASHVPVRLEIEDPEGAAALAGALQEVLPETLLVEDDEDFARFHIEQEDGATVVYGSDNEQEIARIETQDPAAVASALATILGRSMTVAELLSLDNPTSRIVLEASVAGQERLRSMQPQRGIRVVTGGEAPVVAIRRPGEPRTARNSLQLRVRASEDCYVTVVDVDAQGQVTAVFPNHLSEAAGYYPQGRLRAGETLWIPDSLEPENRAGFYADFAPPAGLDTLRVFCTTDLETATLLREAVADLVASPRSVVREALVGELRRKLAATRVRGLRIVAGDEAEEPAVEAVAATSALEGSPAGDVPPAPTWTAVSLTLQVVASER